MSDTKDASRELPSGRFVLRLDPRLHGTLRRAASEADLSLNEYCARTLAGARPGLAGPGWEVVERAAATVEGALVGVVVYGSWARSEAKRESDVDVLIVVDQAVPVARLLYRKWDEEPVSWEGRRVEPHFVHPPPTGELPSGMWAEVAVDGIVLYDRDLQVSRCLVRLRRMIVEGAVVRREAHGQPYWIEAS